MFTVVKLESREGGGRGEPLERGGGGEGGRRIVYQVATPTENIDTSGN